MAQKPQETHKVPPTNLLTTLGLLVGLGVAFGGPWAVQGLRETARYVKDNPRVPCAMAKAGIEAGCETETAAVAQDGGAGCAPPSQRGADGACWFHADGPPCRPPAVIRDGKCWVRELSPPMPPNSHHERKSP